MAFDRPTRTGGDYPDLKAETRDGPRLLAVRVLDFLPAEPGDFPDRRNPGQKSTVYPVLCDVMIIDGPHAGWIYRGWTARYAFTNALRGAASDNPNPTTVPGQQLVIRAERPKKKGQSTETVYGNDPTDEEAELIEREFERFGGWDGPGIARDRETVEAGAPAAAHAPVANATPPAAPAQRPVPPAQPPAQPIGSAPRRPFGNR